jgi:hypothetical protein
MRRHFRLPRFVSAILALVVALAVAPFPATASEVANCHTAAACPVSMRLMASGMPLAANAHHADKSSIPCKEMGIACAAEASCAVAPALLPSERILAAPPNASGEVLSPQRFGRGLIISPPSPPPPPPERSV